MDQAKAIINLKDGIIELEGPVEFVRRYLEKYAPAMEEPSAPDSQADVSGRQVEARVRPRGRQRSCTRAVRTEIKAGFFDEPRSTKAVGERLAGKGVACSIAVLRVTLRKAVQEGKLETAGRGRGLTYKRKSEDPASSS